MTKKGKYCCFLCPSKDYSEKMLSDKCPSCGNRYDFTLNQTPAVIDQYRIVKPLGRGFYASSYLAEFGRLKAPYVLKVTSVKLYDYFKKNFEDECNMHQEVSQDTEHIVPIINYFDADIPFGSITMPCHVAVLEYVKGEPLDEFLKQSPDISARSIAQIAVDLIRIWREFSNKLKYHNDLHANNIIIQRLREDARRAEALDETIRAVAIDLGSVADASKSDSCDLRLGDQHWLCRHIRSLIDKMKQVRRDIDNIEDLDNRIVEALERIESFLLPAASSGRIPTPDHLIKLVRDNFSRGTSPWKEPLRLERFDDAYNALSLDPWYVPYLLVDPEDQWVKSISVTGPMLITGMRGCGKTMLLRALELHARAATKDHDSGGAAVIKRLRNDRYVGLFVSCMNLLTVPGSSVVPAPFERLFFTYCLEAIRSLRHLQEIDRSSISPKYYEFLVEVIEANMDFAYNFLSINSDFDLERLILKSNAALKKGEVIISLKTSPADAFGSLADAFRKCSPALGSVKVFFLLDDVSTRYLPEEVIGTLFSALLFQAPNCAFKITTEAQTLEMALYSPGLVEKARAGRDYATFDLGTEVYEKTKERAKKGELFVERILEQRARYYPSHPKSTPREILGDCALEDIAKLIAATTATCSKAWAMKKGCLA